MRFSWPTPARLTARSRLLRRLGGCRVIERELVDFSDFKNWAIPQAAHPWVLVLDADERITPALAAEIRAVLANPTDNIDGYWIGRENHFMGHRIRHCGWNRDAVLRLFRRDVGRYTQRRVHEWLEVAPERTGRLTNELVHYPVWTYDRYLQKLSHYTQLGAADMHDRGRKASAASMLFRVPMRFVQLYFFRLGFLDGMAGLQICMITAFTSFLKQARLWELNSALAQPDPEKELDRLAA